ncbi:MAG: hypothetical protein VX740_11180 [Pseudomonadota bacterium]|jgi:hypothetical protein|nr:hypothetical protein [Alphaproteobacteria bacterium]MEC9235490.1 hypothetical protein [Pseudomonadota bacterium]MED5423991.1 hypothetical protein [Pseudomonadota bacterium]MEE3322532.1 hypothetical protein [Pseudomonadota bacterium]
MELTILNAKKKNLKFEVMNSASAYKMTPYVIESKTFGPFGPLASFRIHILDKNDKDVLMDLSLWRASPLYKAYQRFVSFDTHKPEAALDIGFALAALLKHPFADFKINAFRTLMHGDACSRNEEVGQIILNKSALKALVSAIRPAAEYAYYKGDDEQQSFWREIFSRDGARYSDGMIAQTFGCGNSMVRPCMDDLQAVLPEIEDLFYHLA